MNQAADHELRKRIETAAEVNKQALFRILAERQGVAMFLQKNTGGDHEPVLEHFKWLDDKLKQVLGL